MITSLSGLERASRGLKAIQELLKQKKPLTFKNIATVSGCSISYLYKWDDIKAYIHELQQQKETTLNSLEEPEGQDRPHSLKTLHQVAKDKIRQLEEEISQLKRQNEILRGHVAEIYEIRDENEKLRTQLKELISSNSSSKIIPIRSSQTSSVNWSETNPQAETKKEKTSDSVDSSPTTIRDKKATFDNQLSVHSSDKATSKEGVKGKKTFSTTKQAEQDIQSEIINSIKEL